MSNVSLPKFSAQLSRRATICCQRLYASHSAHGTTNGRIGPAVRNLLEQYKVSPESVKGSGPKGFLLKGDVLKFINEQKLRPAVLSAPSPTSDQDKKTVKATVTGKSGPADSRGRVKYIDFPLSESRQSEAKAVLAGKNAIPHSYVYMNCGVDSLLQLSSGMAISDSGDLTPFLVRAVVAAVKRVPGISAALPKIDKDLRIGVEMREETGLRKLSLPSANLGLKELAKFLSAKDSGESSTQTNTYSFRIVSLIGSGLDQATPIIMPPQLFAVSVGDLLTRIDSETQAKSKFVNVALTFDAARVSETDSAQFVETIKGFLEKPDTLLLAGGIPRR